MSIINNDGYYEVVWPRSPRQVAVKQIASRLTNLNHKVVAEVWDYQYRGDEVFEWLEHELRLLYPEIRFVNWKEFGSTRGANERQVIATLPEKLRQQSVDAVISAMGA